MAYTYSDELYSDLHKDARGTRPGEYGYIRWNSFTPAQKQIEWDSLIEEMNQRYEQEKLEERRSIDRFEYWVNNIIESGAKDRNQAIQWILEGEDLDTSDYDIEHFEWKQGLPFGYLKQACTLIN
jgi:hypothetical protein